MPQADDPDNTPPPGGENPFPAIIDRIVGAGLVQTADAGDLHRFLEVGRDFSNWIKGRLAKYGFVENVDYVKEEIGSPDLANQRGRGGDRRSVRYHLTLDTAKEIAMVENNEKGRAARRYFIECERRAQEGQSRPALPTEVVELIRRTDGIARMLSGKVTSMQARVEALEEKNAVPSLDFGGTVSAYEMIAMAGVAPEDRQRGTAQMVTRCMISFCAERQVACFRTPAEVNPSRPFRFTKDLASEWLLGERRGLERIRSQVGRMRAKKESLKRGSRQTSLHLVSPTPPDMGRPL